MKTKKQKLLKRNTYTPTNLQVCSSVAVSLNREETLSEHSLKTFDNNPDANQRQHHTVGQTISGIVYVIGINGKILMPSSSSKVRKLFIQKLKMGGEIHPTNKLVGFFSHEDINMLNVVKR